MYTQFHDRGLSWRGQHTSGERTAKICKVWFRPSSCFVYSAKYRECLSDEIKLHKRAEENFSEKWGWEHFGDDHYLSAENVPAIISKLKNLPEVDYNEWHQSFWINFGERLPNLSHIPYTKYFIDDDLYIALHKKDNILQELLILS